MEEVLARQSCSRFIGSKGHAESLEEAFAKNMNVLYIDRRCIQSDDNGLKYTAQLAKPFVLEPFS